LKIPLKSLRSGLKITPFWVEILERADPRKVMIFDGVCGIFLKKITSTLN